MNKDKVYIEGYEVGFSVDTTGAREKKIQVASGEIVSIDERFIYKSIEREKVKVKQFVADWYEENKDAFEANLYRCAYNIPSVFDSAKLNDFERWFLTAGTKPFQTLVNMHQFGYEVEEDKRYLVKVKGVHFTNYLISGSRKDIWFFHSAYEPEYNRIAHTRKQLEDADFGWVFSCEGIEIEEVE